MRRARASRTSGGEVVHEERKVTVGMERVSREAYVE